ncbi:serine/threonine-protein kinase [Spirillospora sp. NPDC052242]
MAGLHDGEPQQLGGYILDRRLGEGGQGVVYEGYGPGPAHARVAVKALHGVPDLGNRKRLAKEIEAWRRVEPHCTAKILDAELDGPVPFVVSEYVPGPNLRQAVDRRMIEPDPYGPEELRRLAIGVAAALVGIHRAKVVHRDLKPENILLGPDGPRVIDFGIARIVAGPGTTGLLKGTLRYMPPERYRGEPGDAKVDVWSWGAVVLFAATGRHAFDGATVHLVAKAVDTHEPDTSMLEEPLRSLVSAALSKDPAGRPRSEDLLLALAGGLDLKAATAQAAAAGAPEPVPPSRAESAEEVFAGLDGRAQDAVPGILLRLVAPGERAEDTLRSARRADFSDGRTDEALVDEVLDAFAAADAVVRDGDAYTLASAALIRAWPRLRGWAAAERGGLEIHRDLAAAARLWDDHGRKGADLYQGTALERARSWAATGRVHLTLNLVERAFLDAAAAGARRRARRRALVGLALAVLLVIATGAAAVAVRQREIVAGQRDRATSVQIAGLAQSLRRTDPDLARRLAVAAARLGRNPDSHSALLTLRYQWEKSAVRLHGFRAEHSALDGAGRILAVAGGTRVEFWNTETRERTGVYAPPAEVVHLSLADDGRTAAVTVASGRTRLVDTSGGRLRDERTYPAPGTGIIGFRTALSPQGAYLVIGRPDRAGADVWDTRTGKKVVTVTGLRSAARRTSFTHDERLISLPGEDGEPFTWLDTRTGDRVDVPDLRPGVDEPVGFSRDGRFAALNAEGGGIRLHDRESGHVVELRGADEFALFPPRFSHDGRFVAQGGIIWSTDGVRRDPLRRYVTTGSECSGEIAHPFTPDGSAMRCVGEDGAVRTFDIGAVTKVPPIKGDRYGSSSSRGAVSADRSTFAAVAEENIEIWSATDQTRRAVIKAGTGRSSATAADASGNAASRAFVPLRRYVTGIELSRDGRLVGVLAGTADGPAPTEIEIWDTVREARLGSVPTPLGRDRIGQAVQEFAFSPDGKSLAVHAKATDGYNALAFWDLATMTKIREIRGNLGYGHESALVFHPDGRSVIAAPNFGRVEFPSGRVLTKGVHDLRVDAIGADGATLFEFPGYDRPFLRSRDARTFRASGGDMRTGPVPRSDGGSVAAGPDGRLFATVHESTDGPDVKLWDRTARRQLGPTFTGPIDGIVAIAFAPDGSTVTAMDQRSRFFTYTVAPSRLVRELCERSGALTEREWRAHIPDVPYRDTC